MIHLYLLKLRLIKTLTPLNLKIQSTIQKISNKSEAIYKEVGYSNLFNSDSINQIISDDGNKIFQIMNSYLVTSTRNSLLIDQERAHQRIIYEKLMKKITNSDISSRN